MKFTRLVIGAMAVSAAIFSSCKKADEAIKDIICTVTPDTLNLDKSTQDKTVSLTATRAWKAEITYEGDTKDWLTLSTYSGSASSSAQTITLTVKENTSTNRVAKVKFSIGLDDATLTVTQSGPGGEYDPYKSKTVKEFIELADTATYYKLSGTVSSFNSTYCSFDITDATGSIYVYSVTTESKAKYASVIKSGGTITLAGKYAYYASKSQHEVIQAIILDFKEGEVVDPTKAEAKTVKEFIDKADKTTYYKLSGTVSSFNSTYCSFDLTDATGSIYVYGVTQDSKTKYASVIKNGGTVTLAGKYSYYSSTSQHEVVEAVIIDFKEGEVVDPTKAEAKTVADFISLANKTTYYKLSGSVSNFDSQYCSFDLTDATGSIYVYSVTAESKAKYATVLMDGFTVTLSGVYSYYTTKQQHEVIDAVILDCKAGTDPYFKVTPASFSVPATASTQAITVQSNVNWTASCDNSAFTLDKTSGNGNDTITVTCTENTGTTARTANITVSTTATVTTQSYTITLEQVAPGASEYKLQPTKNTSNTDYSKMFDVTIDGIDWKLPGNQSWDPDATYGGKMKIGGRLSEATDRYLYSKAPIGGALNKITFRHGKGDTQITVNSLKVSSYATAEDAANGTNALDTKDVTYKDSDETSIAVSGENWTGRYIRIVYNLSSTAPSSNKGIILFYVKFAY